MAVMSTKGTNGGSEAKQTVGIRMAIGPEGLGEPEIIAADGGGAGWDAINAAIGRVYDSFTRGESAFTKPWIIQPVDPLDGICVFSRIAPFPHWHFITYGFTDLSRKSTDDEAVSGYGFELTLRVIRDPTDKEVPVWAMQLLMNLADYVCDTGNRFGRGHHLNCHQTLGPRNASTLGALLFVEDPELPEIAGPFGRARFLQVVGITEDEETAIKSWRSDRMIELLQPRVPLWCTDPTRKSILLDASIAETVREGARREGSGTEGLFLENVSLDRTGQGAWQLVLGTLEAASIADIVRGRLFHKRKLTLLHPQRSVHLVPSHRCRVRVEGSESWIYLDPSAVAELVALLTPGAGEVPLRAFPGLTLRIMAG